MTTDWVAPVITGVVGIAGIGFTWLTGRQARDQAERLALRLAARERRERTLAVYSELLTTGRRLQRASRMWTKSRDPDREQEFDRALDDYAVLAARARLTEPAWVSETVLEFERNFRTHRDSAHPEIRQDDPRFQLETLVDVLRQRTQEQDEVGMSNG